MRPLGAAAGRAPGGRFSPKSAFSVETTPGGFTRDVLAIDASAETDRIVQSLRYTVPEVLRCRGAVVGLSGGVDSSVVFALCIRAFGPRKVIGLIMPEKDSDPASERLARQLSGHLGATPILENVTPVLEAFGCYWRRDQTIRRIFPEYDPHAGYKAKIVLPQNVLQENGLNVFLLTIISPAGNTRTSGLRAKDFLQILAASDLKQRTRMATLYYHAELHHFAVIGAANKNEHDQGFFVKYGDAAVDLNPIVHLYKTQVYQLARHLGVPAAILERPPTADTASAPCTQQESFFHLPFEILDLLWYAREHEIPKNQVARVLGLTEVEVQTAFDDFVRKSLATEYLRLPPLSMDGDQLTQPLSRPRIAAAHTRSR